MRPSFCGPFPSGWLDLFVGYYGTTWTTVYLSVSVADPGGG